MVYPHGGVGQRGAGKKKWQSGWRRCLRRSWGVPSSTSISRQTVGRCSISRTLGNCGESCAGCDSILAGARGDAVRLSYWIAPGRRIILLTVFRKQRRHERAEIERAYKAMQRCSEENHVAEENDETT